MPTVQAVEGASPPTVFTRWMKVVSDRSSPPVGPSWAPTTFSNNQGIAFGSGETETSVRPQTLLVSSESCQVARGGVSFSNGLGLRKWVMICLSWSLNNVACGPKNVHPEGQTM